MPEAPGFEDLRARVSSLEAELLRLRNVLDGASVIVAGLNPDRTVNYVTPSMERVLGYKPDDLLGQDFLSLIHPADRRLMEASSGHPLECRAIHKDGSERVIEAVFSQPVRGDDEERTVIARDVTRRDQHADETTHAERSEALTGLAGGLAHDFNNILTVISGYAELLCARLDKQARLRGFAAHISKSADCASALTGQLISFSRSRLIHPELLCLNTVVTNLHSALAAACGPSVELHVALGDGLGNVKADRAQMEEILLTLVSNARVRMPGGGSIEIETSTLPGGGGAGRTVRLAVSDSGPEISKFALARIFEPFSAGKPHVGASGLALAAVFGGVKQNGGSISAVRALNAEPRLRSCSRNRLDRDLVRPGAMRMNIAKVSMALAGRYQVD